MSPAVFPLSWGLIWWKECSLELSAIVLLEASQIRSKPSSVRGTVRAKSNGTFGCPTLLKDICAQPQVTIGSVTHLNPYLEWGQLACRAEILLGVGSGPPLAAAFDPSKHCE